MRAAIPAIVITAFLSTALTLSASQVFTVVSGPNPVTATVANQVNPPGFIATDLRGTSFVGVTDSTTMALIGTAVLSDFNQNPNFGNMTLFSDNGAFTESIGLVAQSVFLQSNGLVLTVLEEGVPLGTVTDPGLLAFEQPLAFNFDFATSATANNVTASFFVLSSITAVPEPSYCFLLLAALPLAWAGKRFLGRNSIR
jgi:hypothetical protein